MSAGAAERSDPPAISNLSNPWTDGAAYVNLPDVTSLLIGATSAGYSVDPDAPTATFAPFDRDLVNDESMNEFTIKSLGDIRSLRHDLKKTEAELETLQLEFKVSSVTRSGRLSTELEHTLRHKAHIEKLVAGIRTILARLQAQGFVGDKNHPSLGDSSRSSAGSSIVGGEEKGLAIEREFQADFVGLLKDLVDVIAESRRDTDTIHWGQTFEYNEHNLDDLLRVIPDATAREQRYFQAVQHLRQVVQDRLQAERIQVPQK